MSITESDIIKLKADLKAKVEGYGYRGLARALGINHQYLWAIQKGESNISVEKAVDLMAKIKQYEEDREKNLNAAAKDVE